MEKWIVVNHASPGKASGIGAGKLLSAMEKAGILYETKSAWMGAFPDKLIIAAPNTNPMVYNIVEDTPALPESIQFECVDGARVISGSDERGLAYALIEMAERVEAYGEAALLDMKSEINSPDVSVRGIDRFVCNTSDCEWWIDEAYWRYYLEAMLSARFNRIVLLVGFDTSYLSPPYPFFVNVPEYPDVRVKKTGVSRKGHLAALRRLGRLAHEYEMEFVFATWQQSLWLSGQQSMVEGIDDLMGYCAAGIRELVLQCPEIDMIQFRVNHEAGVGTEITAEEYWFRQLEALAEAKKLGADIRLDLRAKGLTDSMICYAKDLGLELTVSTKYWCEHAGLPYHLTRMRTEELSRLENLNLARRYSYSDMLKKPRLHKFVYRLWNDGSTDLFTWGDPDYVRRFVSSMSLGKADGFEIMPMLSLKGGAEDYKYTGWPIFDDPSYRPEGYEDSRYWLCNRLFGRIGYDVNEDDEAWMRFMRQKFGAAAQPLMACISAASRLIPFIVGFHMPVHPQLYYWPEFSTGGALFAEHNHNPGILESGVTYQSTEPGDAGLFYPVDQYAKDALKGEEDGRYTPWQVAACLRRIHDDTVKYLRLAEAAGIPQTPEAKGVVLDMRMLAELALYHRYKLAAGVELSLYKEDGGGGRLDAACYLMKKAKNKWYAFAKLGEKYHSRLLFSVGNGGAHRDGHWNDFIPELDADIAKLQSMLGREPQCRSYSFPPANFQPSAWADNVPKTCTAGEALAIRLENGPLDSFRGGVTLRYRHTNQLEGDFLSAPMKFAGGIWYGCIPAEYIEPQWDLLVYFEAVAVNGDGVIYPGLWHPWYPLPYHIVEVK